MIRKAVPATPDGKKNCVLFQFKSLLKNKNEFNTCQDEMHQL